MNKSARRNMSKILNDPIHGTIELDPLLIKIIDTPQFQRLRNIKQLGGCYFVYPSASHNRFEHSIGTCFLAGKLACQLQKQLHLDIEKLGEDDDDEKKMYVDKLKEAIMTDDDKLCIEIAGLCHDIGHGPYSHLFDRLFLKAMMEKDQKTKKWTVCFYNFNGYFITSNPKITHTIFVYKIIRKNGFFILHVDNFVFQNEKVDEARYYMYEIVANKRNEIDVDKMDYFARDCHGLGMKSNFDHLRYISQCRVMFSSDKPDETTIAVRDKEEYNLYELFHTRIGLYRRAYFHKATKAVELMLTDVLVKANNHLTFKNNEGKEIQMSTAWNHPEVYEKLTDNVFEAILLKEDPTAEMQKAQKLINNVYKRKLYKLVDETLPVETIKTEEKRMKELLLKTGLTDDDFAVQKVTYSYGKGRDNPITSVYFYSKDNDTDCFPKTKSKKTSLFLPDIFQEEVLRIYSKNSKNCDIINKLKKETTKCLKKVGLDSVNNSAIELKNAATKKATKHKLSAKGKSGPSTRSYKKKKTD
ncbi:deoxynucleoside triphosphate triphosphohydrolase SAMHD1-like [Mytilus trossulus]|uniref:deoxynucleoside triphosphate triphosphohydrolase SAMHD1-like n=1 Tax=Mytilus trossulus TaxID=6551 RepID=UPI00300778D5